MSNPNALKHTGFGKSMKKPASNPFAKWYAAKGSRYTMAELGKKLGTHPQTLYKLKSGRAKPNRKLAIKISELTGGAVSVESWDLGQE